MTKIVTSVSLDYDAYTLAKAKDLNISKICNEALHAAAGSENPHAALASIEADYKAKIAVIENQKTQAEEVQQKIVTEQDAHLQKFLDCGPDGVSCKVIDDQYRLENWVKLIGIPAKELRQLKTQAQIEYNRAERAGNI